LKNYWYVAARSNEIDRHLLGRILLDDAVVFFRTEAGAITALEDRCPHRGYPLHKGRLIGNTVECGYHGISFDCSGRCIKVPGQTQIPTGANIRRYPVIETLEPGVDLDGRSGSRRSGVDS
jgi:vanillate O-demethylase monooxygenase subunit